MTKIMDFLNSVVDFFSTYDTYAKVLMLTGLIITFGTMVLASRKDSTDNSKNGKDLLSILDSDPSIDILKSQLYGNLEFAEEYFSKPSYEKIHILNGFQVDNTSFDYLIYYHNSSVTQIGRPLLLINFYDVEVKNVNWESLDSDWEHVFTSLSWPKIQSQLERTNGFNHPLVISSAFIQEEKPMVHFIQLAGRRKQLNQLDLTQMHNKRDHGSFVNSEEPSDRVFRTVATYDLMIEKFSAFLN